MLRLLNESSFKWDQIQHILNSVKWEIWFVVKSGQNSQTVNRGNFKKNLVLIGQAKNSENFMDGRYTSLYSGKING